jgi:lysyl-tRNA synthetase class 2
MNEDSRDVLRTRSQIVSAIRRYMDEQMNALEVETPMLHAIMGGASAKPFVTRHNTLDTDFFLRVAPELYLKRLIVGGFADDVYEIGRCFRNEGISPRHNPEFTSIEGYHAYRDYNDMMDLVEGLVQECVKAVHGSLKVPFGPEGEEIEIDFSGPWPRKTMCELVEEATGVDLLACEDAATAHAKAKEAGVPVDPKANWGQVVEAFFEEKVEKTLIQPTHVTDFPMEISPLAKTHRDNPRLVERFETFVNTWEIANAFTELNDPKVQRERFEGQVAQREAGDEEAQMLDEDFITALEFGLPPTGGWGLGIDRLCMLLTNSQNIRDVILFPTLKPVKG